MNFKNDDNLFDSVSNCYDYTEEEYYYIIDDSYNYDDGYDHELYQAKKKKNRIMSVAAVLFVLNIAGTVLFCSNDMKTIKASTAGTANYASVPTKKPVEIKEEEVPLAVEEDVEPTPTPTPEMLEHLKQYYDENNDLIGWLTIDGTPINNPVMFTPDNQDYYLDKDFYGNYLKAGTLFIDANSQIGADESNIIIYGHNMKNQTMFGSLKKYANYDYYQEHKYITFDTLYETGKYEVMVSFYAKILQANDQSFKYYKFTRATCADGYQIFLDNVFDKALYKTAITKDMCKFGQGDRFITLSTCSHHTENGRFVVIAKKVE